MLLVKPSHEILTKINREEVLKHIELCGRTCYKSEDKITENSSSKFVSGIFKSGHYSVLEHFNISVRFICDRGVTHELVRHRLASYSQESTRYVNYNKKGMTFIIPPWVNISPGEYKFYSDVSENLEYNDSEWIHYCLYCEKRYNDLIEHGWKPQEARSILPNSLKTEIVTTTNLREWYHILNLRTSKAAHPQIREIMFPLLTELNLLLPEIYESLIV